jgi:flavin-dependent dehydrogenase
MDESRTDVLVIGGGLAGLMAAIHLSRSGHKVALVEKKDYPRHKVCGEYLSFEALPLLKEIGVDLTDRPKVSRTMLSIQSGQSISADLPLGGIGVSRYFLDHALYRVAMRASVEIYTKEAVRSWEKEDGGYKAMTNRGRVLLAKALIDTHGKPPWPGQTAKGSRQVGVKQYYDLPFDEDLVVLHNFEGGYGGAVQVETGLVDVAYMVSEKVFSRYKDPGLLEEYILHGNPQLKRILKEGRPVLDRRLTISNFILGRRRMQKDGALMAGDAAAMIPPATGNGMAMALHSGRIAGLFTSRYLEGRMSKEDMIIGYEKEWKSMMGSRLRWGGMIQSLMESPAWSRLAYYGLRTFPSLLPAIISKTHGRIKYREDVV